MTNGRTGRIRCGVVGVGRMGRHHARIYSQVASAELVGVVDLVAQRREDAAAEFGGRALMR
jgi:predicted dehydrogenase